MPDFLKLFDSITPYLKFGALAVGVALGLVAAAALMYVLQSTGRPLLRIVQFMIAHTPGKEPSEPLAGVFYGVRMLGWAVVVGVVTWFIAH